VRLGVRVGPFPARLDVETVQKFVEATGDPSGRVQDAAITPPVALVTQLWEAQSASRAALVPEDFQRAATGGVHGEHDLVLCRPIRPGEPLWTWVEGRAARATGRHSVITLRYTTLDARHAPVAEQLWTTVWLGVTCDESGVPPPAHDFPDGFRARPYGRWRVDVDPGMARRYAEASGDWSQHHFEAGAARRSGAAAPFLHGLCTLALCAQGVSELVADGDPARITRIAVRFVNPVLLGTELTLDLYDAGPLGCAFEAAAGGRRVIAHGRAELR
jgi:acyl dehydratase